MRGCDGLDGWDELEDEDGAEKDELEEFNVFIFGFPIVGILFVCELDGTQSEKAKDDISIFLIRYYIL